MLPKKPCPVPDGRTAVAAHHERRPLACRSREVRVGRAVEERVRGQAASVGNSIGSGHGHSRRIEGDRRRATQDA